MAYDNRFLASKLRLKVRKHSLSNVYRLSMMLLSLRLELVSEQLILEASGMEHTYGSAVFLNLSMTIISSIPFVGILQKTLSSA